MRKSIVSVGSSTFTGGRATGFSGSAMVSPMSTESRPTRAQMSPACTSSVSTRPRPANRRSFEDPRGRFLLEDARRAVVQGGPLDIILSEPSNPWISGVASLFTVEFYERARNRLVDGGVFGQWVHLYEIEDELILSILAAIDQTFPEWSAYLTSAADMIIVAGKGSLAQPDWRVVEYPGIQEDLAHAPPITPGVFESLFLFDHTTMRPLLRSVRPMQKKYWRSFRR